MRTLILLLVIVAALFAQHPDSTAYLNVYSSPSGLQVRIDSLYPGKTPLEHVPLPPGLHQVEVTSPYPGMWNYANLQQTVLLEPGQDTTLYFRYQKLVPVNSVPFHALVQQGEVRIGHTPLYLPFESNRGKTFLVSKLGYQSREFTLTTPEPVLIRLQPIVPEISMVEQSSFTYALFHTNLKKKFLFLTGTLVNNWLAFYFKNVADAHYERYLRTSDPAAMERYWNEAKKYDRYSDITLGVSYLFLSGLIYTVVWR